MTVRPQGSPSETQGNTEKQPLPTANFIHTVPIKIGTEKYDSVVQVEDTFFGMKLSACFRFYQNHVEFIKSSGGYHVNMWADLMPLRIPHQINIKVL